MEFGFLLDSEDQLHDYDKSESTRLIMQQSREKGHRVRVVFKQSILVDNGSVYGQVHGLEQFEEKGTISLSEPGWLPLARFDLLQTAMFPPLDPSVVYCLNLAGTVMVNDPVEILRFGEKITPLHQSPVMAWTLVGQEVDEMFRRMSNYEADQFILKPVRSYGGTGVELIDLNRGDAETRLREYQHDVRGSVVVQEKLPIRETGDKRILLLQDEIIGWEKRIVDDEGIVANYSAGGEIVACELTENDRELVKNIRVHTEKYNLPLVGVDMIGGKITEINVTNPGGLAFTKKFNDLNQGEKVVDYLETVARKEAGY